MNYINNVRYVHYQQLYTSQALMDVHTISTRYCSEL